MQKVKHKFSNEIMNDLLLRAKALPRVSQVDGAGNPRYKQVQVSGHLLKESDLKPGEKLNPKLVYTVNEIVLVDHYATMVEQYRIGGHTAVLDYEQATMALKRVSMAKLKQPWYVKLHTFFTGLFKR